MPVAPINNEEYPGKFSYIKVILRNSDFRIFKALSLL